MSQIAVCDDGLVSDVGNGAVSCSTSWVAVEYSTSFEVSDIDPSVASGMIGAGFMSIVTLWMVGYGFRYLLKAVKQF